MLKNTLKDLTFVLVFLLIITLTVTSSFPSVILSGYASVTSTSSSGNSSSSLESSMKPYSIETKKIRIGDIDIAYQIFGKGDPLLFIPGFSMTMDMWKPMLNGLPENHTIILFDNRGIGQTTAGNATTTDTAFTIDQFTNDTASLIDALNIKQTYRRTWIVSRRIHCSRASAVTSGKGQQIDSCSIKLWR